MPPTRFGAGVAAGDVEVLTAARTLTREDNGKTFVTGAADLVVSLPATEPGLRFTFVTSTLSATTGLSISPVAADKIVAKGITPADNKDLINSAASDAIGDTVTLVSDGVDGWYAVSLLGTWAREA